MARAAILVAVALALGFVSGCSRTVLVSDGAPVRIGPGARARVYAMVDGSWVLGSESIALPEGYFLVSPRFVEP
jgi:hypothetical protein